MAKVNFGTIVNDARGKIDGIVFSKSRSGAYVRGKVSPSQPQTNQQSTRRTFLTQATREWSASLTAAQRFAWDSLAKFTPVKDRFGHTILLTGHQLYVRLNATLLYYTGASIADPPNDLSGEAILTFTAVADASAHTLALTFTPTPVPADTIFAFFATPQLPSGRLSVASRFTYLTKAIAAGTSPVAAGTAYEAKFGTLTEDKVIGLYAIPINALSGAQGQPIRILTTVVA
jgi:hypothetical protein